MKILKNEMENIKEYLIKEMEDLNYGMTYWWTQYCDSDLEYESALKAFMELKHKLVQTINIYANLFGKDIDGVVNYEETVDGIKGQLRRKYVV